MVTLDETNKLYLLELFHGKSLKLSKLSLDDMLRQKGPTFAFKDVALQFLGNLFEYFLVRRNKGKKGKERHHLTVIGATSGDTGSAAIYGLRGKKDVSVFILYPKGKVSPVQEAQMTTVLDKNVYNLSIEGTFDDCQDIVKALFADAEINKSHKLAAVNSINWARILAQITYYFHAYFSLLRSANFVEGSKLRFVVPTGNFGDILAGWFATRMGLPVSKLVIATNSNDILDRFWKSGSYEKHPVSDPSSDDSTPLSTFNAAHPSGVKETLSPAMDILVSSNFERLLWYLAFEGSSSSTLSQRRQEAGTQVSTFLSSLRISNVFTVSPALLNAARRTFESHRVSDLETLSSIRKLYHQSLPSSLLSLSHPTSGTLLNNSSSYILDPHTAVGVAAAWRSLEHDPGTHHIALATAHPAKFATAVDLALGTENGFRFEDVMPIEFLGLEKRKRRVRAVGKGEGIEGVRRIIVDEVAREIGDKGS